MEEKPHQIQQSGGQQPPVKEVISDEAMMLVYDEIMNDIREDRKEVSELILQFGNMAMNDGDSTTSTKEALVNLMKIKADLADKKSKIADLKTRIKLRDRDTFKPYLAAQQTTVKIGGLDKKKKMEILKIVEVGKKNAD
jgi:hypothetical protein